MNIRRKKWLLAQKRKEAETAAATPVVEVEVPVEAPKAPKKRRKRAIPKTPSTRPRKRVVKK